MTLHFEVQNKTFALMSIQPTTYQNLIKVGLINIIIIPGMINAYRSK